MKKHKGRVVVLHLAAQFPFAGVIWQLLHHLIGFRNLGLEVFYIEDHGAWTYDPLAETLVADPQKNLAILARILERFEFGERWCFWDEKNNEYLGPCRERYRELLAEADAVFNLCAATAPRDEHGKTRCLVFLETDPGKVQIQAAAKDPSQLNFLSPHHLFFTYGENIGASDCLLPTGGINWLKTRPPVLLDQWNQDLSAEVPDKFTTVCTWHNKDINQVIDGRTYYWSKDVNFRKLLQVARQAGQPIELATNLSSGPDYDNAIAGGFSITPAVPMSLDLDGYRNYLVSSRGEFTAAKDIYAGTRSGWFSDRSVCYLAAGRPVVTQSTGFEKYVPTGAGLLVFDTPEEAVEAIRAVNADYQRHSLAAREIAREYFDANILLTRMIEAVGL
jgi:hypothetical protein